jgi:hypothetical protein
MVTILYITIKCLQTTCLPCESTEIRVDMSVEAHTAPCFGIYTIPRQDKCSLRQEFIPQMLQQILYWE